MVISPDFTQWIPRSFLSLGLFYSGVHWNTLNRGEIYFWIGPHRHSSNIAHSHCPGRSTATPTVTHIERWALVGPPHVYRGSGAWIQRSG